MVELMLKNWLAVIALIIVGVGAVWGLVLAGVYLIERGKKSGVEEITAPGVKIDFDKDK